MLKQCQSSNIKTKDSEGTQMVHKWDAFNDIAFNYSLHDKQGLGNTK